ncbi:hypothetical protein ABG067_007159 [Albugo candida]
MFLSVIAVSLLLLAVILVHVYFLPHYLLRFLVSRSDPSVFWCTFTSARTCSLTIDDAPSNSTSAILDQLKKFKVTATFFIISDQIPGHEEVMKRIVDEGHTLGNHLTEDRPSIRDSLETFEGKIMECESAIMEYQVIGKGKQIHKMKSKWLRPASGWFTSEMFRVIQKHGYRVCMGSVYPHDAQIKSEIINSLYLKYRTKSGSVLLIHDRPWTSGVLKDALPDLTSKYKFISVDELYDIHVTRS